MALHLFLLLKTRDETIFSSDMTNFLIKLR